MAFDPKPKRTDMKTNNINLKLKFFMNDFYSWNKAFIISPLATMPTTSFAFIFKFIA